MWLHAFVDVKRKKFATKSGIYSRLKMIRKRYRVTFLKLLEDEIFWDHIKCQQWQQSLKTIFPEEIEAGVEIQIIQKWHQTLNDYFRQRPSALLNHLAESHQGYLNVDPKTIAMWSIILPALAADSRFCC